MNREPSPLRKRLREVAVEAMLDSAEQAMIKKGYEQTTMQEIAAAAGCATGTFYLYFKNKEELLEAIISRRARASFDLARQAMSGAEEPLEKLRLSYESFLRFAQEHRAFFRLAFMALPMRHRILFQMLGGPARQEHEEYNRLEAQLLRQAQDQGQIRRDFSAELLQEFMDAVTMSMLEQFTFAGENQSAEEQMRIFWGLVTGGLGAPRSGHVR